MSKLHLVTIHKAGQATFVGEADGVKVEIWKPYGSLVITITDMGKIVLDACDGEGAIKVTHGIDPDGFADVNLS
jgi:hypothetical protein